MFTDQLTAFDALALNSLPNNLVDDLSDDIVSNLQLSTDVLTTSPQLLSSLKESLSPSEVLVSETVTDTQLDVLEVIDAPIEDLAVFDFNQPSLGDVATNTRVSLGGLYDDPIEYGDPFSDADYWRQQQGANSCAVVAQICVYESLTGYRISEDDASNYAYQQGWFDPNTGTSLVHVGKVLNTLGIDTYQPYDASLDTLADALVRGDKPIVGLDGNEIWNPQYDWYGNPIEQSNAGHAVWVTGIDLEHDGSVNIILNDSGHSGGMTSVVDAYDFIHAWEDYGNFVSIADNPFT
ncbi:hypothetical protein IQ230_12625 [Gloeocapsopsis crepidinum LEGE 06123]|uniref:Peptidase C39-like domain-containing protein n=1 Tax=Gloeocapsopsis crepidinum LEGE 06123 TaxID=588587 RepID=A0ABR9UV41_9CHRO|nr:hypothetical protein [Gloeocapsopsis crepidinum]MBE9191183.1 hypothetical protein [Gloeocapsopsis crepidinum LEGE 06123]